MKPDVFNLDVRLADDSHYLFKWHDLHILLHKNACLPWIIVVPETNVIEFHDLNRATQLDVIKVSQVVGAVFKSKFNAEKINFAAIGNVVKQLHVHVIGRNREDPLWPDVVWGAALPKSEYSKEHINQLKNDLLEKLDKDAA